MSGVVEIALQQRGAGDFVDREQVEADDRFRTALNGDLRPAAGGGAEVHHAGRLW